MKKSTLSMIFILTLLSLAFVLSAQVTVSGRVIGNDAPNGLEGATVLLVSANNEYETETNESGNFSINNVQGTAAGIQYQLTITLEGYQQHTSQRTVLQANLNLGNIRLNENAWPIRGLTLTESAERDSMLLVWDVPEPISGTEQWFQWDSGQNADGIGTNAAVQFIVAQRFTPANLEELDVTGLFLTSVKFFPRHQGATYTIRVYRGGAGQPLAPGQQIVSQQAANVVNEQWNEVILTNPVEILPEQEIWFGYHINTPGGFPAGCDAGPAIHNFGNIMFFNNAWTTLRALNEALNYNWNIAAYAGFGRGDRSVELVLPQPEEEAALLDFDSNENLTLRKASDFGFTTLSGNDSRPTRLPERNNRPAYYRELEGYEVYRFNVLDEEEEDDWTRLAAVEDTTYVDDSWGELDPGYYKYAVRAEYTGDVYSDFVKSRAFPQGLRFTLRGRVLASDTDEGLAGATVTFNGIEEYETESGEDGNFIINNVMGDLEQTQYQLVVHKTGYQRHTSNRNVTYENVNVGNIVLNEIAYAVHGVYAELNDDEEIDIIWNSPLQANPQWLHWDDGENANGVGTDAAAQFQIAARYTPDILAELDVIGLNITTIRFFPRHGQATYTIKVWRGGGIAPINPGQEVTTQVATNIVNEQWNEVVLNNPVRIQPNQELWFGYHVNTPGGFPAGCDAGPAVNNFGNMMHFNNVWQTMITLNPALNYNWNIQAFAGLSAGERTRSLSLTDLSDEVSNIQESPIFAESAYSNPAALDVSSNHGVVPTENWRPGRRYNENTGRDSFTEMSRGLEGYNLFRFDVSVQDEPEEWELLATQMDTTFTDTEWEELEPAAYRYAVVAEYSNDVFADPAFSNVILKDMLCFVTVRVTSNSEDPVAGAQITLTNIDGNPQHRYSDTAPANGVIVFNDVWRGTYTVKATLPGFEPYVVENVHVDNTVFVYPLELVEALNEVVNVQYQLFNNNNVILSWEAPGTVQGTPQWINWDNGVNNDGIGTNSAIQFMVAARFTPANIEALDIANLHITSVKFFPREAAAQYTIKVWRGGTATPALSPGQEVHSQQVREFVPSAWNEVVLSTPVEIIPDQELWFGYLINTPGGFPAGCDAGPAVVNYGNVMYFGNVWQTLNNLNPALVYNWNLQAYAGAPGRGENVVVSRNRLETVARDNAKERALTGYKVKRNDTVLAENITGLTYRDISIPIGNYVYSVIAQYTTGESEPVSTSEVVVLSTEEEGLIPLVTELQGNYPNPFNPDTKIAFTLAAEENVRIDIFNLKGQKIRSLVDENLAAGQHSVVWDGTNDNGVEVGSGIYLYRMKSDGYSTTKKMIMMK